MRASSDVVEGESVKRREEDQGNSKPCKNQIGHGHLLFRMAAC